MDFLRRDLVHLFDETGIDKTSYEEVVEFIDPITSYRRLSGGCPANQCCQTHQSNCGAAVTCWSARCLQQLPEEHDMRSGLALL